MEQSFIGPQIPVRQVPVAQIPASRMAQQQQSLIVPQIPTSQTPAPLIPAPLTPAPSMMQQQQRQQQQSLIGPRMPVPQSDTSAAPTTPTLQADTTSEISSKADITVAEPQQVSSELQHASMTHPSSIQQEVVTMEEVSQVTPYQQPVADAEVYGQTQETPQLTTQETAQATAPADDPFLNTEHCYKGANRYVHIAVM